MRLTLRTLLAYLDDTLEPAQAKEIGQKVAESDAARELIERIKQVTRRRRITAPPATGPSKLDPNTIAEYLDNEVSPEAAAEVEAIALASDVHLAEVAACHQILTLVLGEPMSVPPPSKQRMYALVKGPEAIPFRKPAPGGKEKDHEPTAGKDVDDTLRLGLPPVSARSSLASKLLLFGGGFAAACLLLVAIWNVLNMSGEQTKPEDPPKDVATVDDKMKEKDKDKLPEKDKAAGEKDKAGEDKVKDKEEDKKDKDMKEVDEPRLEEIAVGEADMKTVKVVGQYQPEEGKDPVLCLQETDKGEWKRLTGREADVFTAKPLLSMPGGWASLYLPKGMRLTLCGSTPEIFGLNILFPLYESKVVLHDHDKLLLDMTLLRGQVLLTNLKDKPAQVRVRFANPYNPVRPEAFEILLHHKGSQVMVSLLSTLDGEPFYPDPKAKRRGPMNIAVCLVVKGFASVKLDAETFGRGPNSLFHWTSASGRLTVQDLPNADIALQEMPPPEGADEKSRAMIASARNAMKAARASLAARMDGGPIRVKLAEVLQSIDPQKPMDPKAPSPMRVMLSRLVPRCIAALGAPADVSSLLEMLDPPMNNEVRHAARDALLHWLASDRENDYVLYDLLEEKYRKVNAERIMRLTHGFGKKELTDPATYEELIDYLNHPNAVIRELASFRLYQIVPAGIPYSAWDSSEIRERAIAQWRALIPPGSLPPAPGKKK